MLKHFFSQDKPLVGLVVGLGSLLIATLLLTIGLLITGTPVGEHLRWYGGIFIVLLLLLRYYIKLQKPIVTKTLIVILFLSFIIFMYLLFQTHSITLK
ncbi:MAG: hypothetical protein ACSW8I_05165 [bacterium]